MTICIDKKIHNKYKKCLNYNSHILRFGDYGIKSCSFNSLTQLKLLTIEKLLIKSFKVICKGSNNIKMWNLIQMNSTLTRLSPESRMGKGKGNVYTTFSYIRPGQILFEFSGVSGIQANLFRRNLKTKIPFQTKLVER
jgi:large subunit ribosomal protein L16